MDGLIFLLIVGAVTALVVWRKRVKRAEQERVLAEQWKLVREISDKLDALIEGKPEHEVND